MKKLFLIITISFLLSTLKAVEPINFAVRLKASIDTTASYKIKLNWLKDSNTNEIEIKRKEFTTDKWTNLALLDSTAIEFIDSTVIPNTVYEYFIRRKFTIQTDSTPQIYDAYGYITVTKDFAPNDYNGRLLLLIDSTLKDSLKHEINRFIYDLTGDGWLVIPKYVPRTEQFQADRVQQIKQLIIDEFNSSQDSLTALILLGRIAVPYSGKYAIDGHPNHLGAWVADLYYSDIFGNYTDTIVNDTTAERKENKNIPGDGKFDNNQIANKAMLQMGRIDFYNIQYYQLPEIELYRKYLNKNHQFRQHKLTPDYKAIIDDNFGMYAEPFASNAWADFSAILSPDSVFTGDFVRPFNTNPIIWSYGCGAGSYWGVENTVSLWHLDTTNTGGIFSILFGSYNADWDIKDNILRAQLAYSPYGLTVSWSGRPFWHFHHLSAGFTIGYSTLLSQNNQITYESNTVYGHRYMHISLLGDPTLKMYYDPPVENLQIYITLNRENTTAYLHWNQQEKAIGYNVYRTDKLNKKFVKLNNELIKENNFTDLTANTGINIYMVRAVYNRQTPSGNFYNLSQGTIKEIDIPRINYSKGFSNEFHIYPNPSKIYANLTFSINEKSPVTLTIWDLQGKLVKNIINNKTLDYGYYKIEWDLRNEQNHLLTSGIYFVKFQASNFKTDNILIIQH